VDDDCENSVHQVRIRDEGAHIRSPHPVGVKISNFLQSKAIEFWLGAAKLGTRSAFAQEWHSYRCNSIHPSGVLVTRIHSGRNRTRGETVTDSLDVDFIPERVVQIVSGYARGHENYGFCRNLHCSTGVDALGDHTA
jgi:hypothetical protein